jgi:hypothetical protein
MGKFVGRGRLLFVLVAAVAVGTIASPIRPAAGAGNSVVCPNDNLQAAIDSASAGSTLRITGTCTGSFRILDKDLTLVGPAVLDGAKAGRVLSIAGSNVTLRSLTIQRGSSDDGGGIEFSNPRTLTLEHVTLANNSAQHDGGGIFNGGGNAMVMMRDSTVSGNTAQRNGGGLWGPDYTIERSSVTNNSAGGNGGGILGIFTMTLDSSTVSNNSAANGGGMWVAPDDAKVTIAKSTFSGNKPDQCRC